MRKREGIEPRNQNEQVGADVVRLTEGHIKGAQLALALANPPGSETMARHQGRVGNSGGPMGSSMDGSRVAQPANRKEARWPMGSRISPYERRHGVMPTEQRGAHPTARSMATPPAPRGGRMAKTGIERRASRARRGTCSAT